MGMSMVMSFQDFSPYPGKTFYPFHVLSFLSWIPCSGVNAWNPFLHSGQISSCPPSFSLSFWSAGSYTKFKMLQCPWLQECLNSEAGSGAKKKEDAMKENSHKRTDKTQDTY
jgi:hypothetical protein